MGGSPAGGRPGNHLRLRTEATGNYGRTPLVSSGRSTMSEEAGSEVPTDPVAQELANQKSRVEVRKLSAEALKAERDALIPTFPTELPTGTLTVPDQASPIGVLAAY